MTKIPTVLASMEPNQRIVAERALRDLVATGFLDSMIVDARTSVLTTWRGDASEEEVARAVHATNLETRFYEVLKEAGAKLVKNDQTQS